MFLLDKFRIHLHRNMYVDNEKIHSSMHFIVEEIIITGKTAF